MITPFGGRAFTLKGLKGVFECTGAKNVPAGTNVLEFTCVPEGKLYNITDLSVVNMHSPFTYMWWLKSEEQSVCPIICIHEAAIAGFWDCKPVNLWFNPGECIYVEIYSCLQGDNIYASINGSERSL